jgi:hypothetical protein
MLLQNSNAGYIELNINKYRVINNPSTLSGMLLFANDNNGPITTRIKIRINEVIMEYDNASHNVYAFVETWSGNPSAWNLDLEIEKPLVLLRRMFLRTGGTSINKIKANVTSKEVLILNTNTSGGSLTINDSILRRNSNGSDLNLIVQSTLNANKLEIRNSLLIKESLGTDTTGSLISLVGVDSKTQIKDCEIYLREVGIDPVSGFIADAPDITQGEIYFKNTNSNIDLAATAVDLNTVGNGLYPNDLTLNNIDL